MLTNYCDFKYAFKAILLCTLINFSLQKVIPCTNPNGNAGRCLSIYYCQSLQKTLKQVPLPDDDKKFLEESKCGDGVGPEPRVCCTSDERRKKIDSDDYDEKDSSKLPPRKHCGFQSLQRRIYNGIETDIDEFPWMVLLEYRLSSGQIDQKCAGSIINSRYILTAAHCLTGKILRVIGPLVSVRLGEHDLRTEIDCADQKLQKDCNLPAVIRNDIDEVIPHENYSSDDKHQFDDIGLIRLKNPIEYNNFTSPVCLPSAIGSQFLRSSYGQNLTVAGWGKTTTESKSQTKQKLAVPVVSHENCSAKFSTKGVIVKDDNQICAGGKFYEDSCQGDSGGPLMKNTNYRYVIEGVVSYGHKCGLEDWPAIYTRVSNYEDWIKSKLRS